MEQHLFILLFFTGIIPCVQALTPKYYLVQQGRRWTDAQLYCRSTHMDLAVIKNSDEMMELQNQAQAQSFSSVAWIGLYSDIYAWRWTYQNEPVGNMRAWDEGEPNNRNGDQNCGAVTPWGWWDLACTDIHSFLCIDEKYISNDRYVYVSNKTDWFSARAYCKENHTDLASPRDEQENLFFIDFVPGVTWFGMFKDPWKWVDNTNFSYVSWMRGEPDNYYWNETCGYLDKGQAGDAQCSIVMPFYCYSAERPQLNTKLQVVRMRIRSSQDLSNPAVHVAILDTIKQKLKDAVMKEDIDVKWRVKPDGSIFLKETN